MVTPLRAWDMPKTKDESVTCLIPNKDNLYLGGLPGTLGEVRRIELEKLDISLAFYNIPVANLQMEAKRERLFAYVGIPPEVPVSEI
ncbi:hypothetical protein FRB94_002465 [Tulasnella sp. JGI-2019a]|nr:hypothetical protein FRB94_002465 [Tulasnella sp. JGI-2019a]